jgi:hypothetical protein
MSIPLVTKEIVLSDELKQAISTKGELNIEQLKEDIHRYATEGGSFYKYLNVRFGGPADHIIWLKLGKQRFGHPINWDKERDFDRGSELHWWFARLDEVKELHYDIEPTSAYAAQFPVKLTEVFGNGDYEHHVDEFINSATEIWTLCKQNINRQNRDEKYLIVI